MYMDCHQLHVCKCSFFSYNTLKREARKECPRNGVMWLVLFFSYCMMVYVTNYVVSSILCLVFPTLFFTWDGLGKSNSNSRESNQIISINLSVTNQGAMFTSFFTISPIAVKYIAFIFFRGFSGSEILIYSPTFLFASLPPQQCPHQCLYWKFHCQQRRHIPHYS